jgi:two-component system, LytTR family, response regulator
MSEPFRVLLVDDEPPALKRLESLLRDLPAFVVVGCCADGEQAVVAILNDRPDLVLLDIQMPGMSGFEVIREVGEQMPLVIFVTAHDEFALEAFRHRGFDYVIKPIDRERLRESMERALTRLESDRRADDLGQLRAHIGELLGNTAARRRVPVRTADGRVRFIGVDDIQRVQVDESYLQLFVGKEVHRVRMTLGDFAARMPRDTFLRVHRSVMVNVSHIREIQPWFHGDFAIIMRDGSQVLTGRTYREQIRALTELG